MEPENVVCSKIGVLISLMRRNTCTISWIAMLR